MFSLDRGYLLKMGNEHRYPLELGSGGGGEVYIILYSISHKALVSVSST